jgi:hypothetical protein
MAEAFRFMKTASKDEQGPATLGNKCQLSICDSSKLSIAVCTTIDQSQVLNLKDTIMELHHLFWEQKPTRAFMNNQEPDLNLTPAETDSAKTNESVRREGSELPVDQRSSYLRSRQIALKKFSPQGGDPS